MTDYRTWVLVSASCQATHAIGEWVLLAAGF